MLTDLPPQVRAVAEAQAGVVTVRQAAAAGVSKELLRSRAALGRWQRVH